MNKILITFFILLSSNVAQSAIYKIEILGTLTETTESNLDYVWSLNGANYHATYIIDDSDHSYRNFRTFEVTEYDLKSATLKLSGSDFDNIYQGGGNTLCCGNDFVITDFIEGVAAVDQINVLQGTDIGESTFRWGGNLHFPLSLFNFDGNPDFPALLQFAEYTGGSFLMDTTYREEIIPRITTFGLGGGGKRYKFTDVEYRDYSPTFSVTVVPTPAAVWLFGSALIGLVGIKRKR